MTDAQIDARIEEIAVEVKKAIDNNYRLKGMVSDPIRTAAQELKSTIRQWHDDDYQEGYDEGLTDGEDQCSREHPDD